MHEVKGSVSTLQVTMLEVSCFFQNRPRQRVSRILVDHDRKPATLYFILAAPGFKLFIMALTMLWAHSVQKSSRCVICSKNWRV